MGFFDNRLYVLHFVSHRWLEPLLQAKCNRSRKALGEHHQAPYPAVRGGNTSFFICIHGGSAISFRMSWKLVSRLSCSVRYVWPWSGMEAMILDNIPQGGWREAQIHDPVIQFPLNLNLPSTNYLIFLQSIWTGPSQTSRRPRSSPAVTKLNPAAGHRAPPWPNSIQRPAIEPRRYPTQPSRRPLHPQSVDGSR